MATEVGNSGPSRATNGLPDVDWFDEADLPDPEQYRSDEIALANDPDRYKRKRSAPPGPPRLISLPVIIAVSLFFIPIAALVWRQGIIFGSQPVGQIQAGQCIEDLPDTLGPGEQIARLDIVDCSEPHDVEVIGTTRSRVPTTIEDLLSTCSPFLQDRDVNGVPYSIKFTQADLGFGSLTGGTILCFGHSNGT